MHNLALFGNGQQLANGSRYVPPSPIQLARLSKDIPSATLEAVTANSPMSGIPRDCSGQEEIDLSGITQRLLEQMCPDVPYFGEYLSHNSSEKEVLTFLDTVVSEHRGLGLLAQADTIKSELERFLNIRYGLPKALEFMQGESLLRPDTIIPMRYLPDICMAAPVWYRYSQEKTNRKKELAYEEFVRSMCGSVSSQQWADMFMLFNGRFRPLEEYVGDLIPHHVLKRMHEAAPLFDSLVIMTPYLDVVAREWKTGKWTRTVDPYVVGFKKDVPAFFVLARFSDSGVFPLFDELVADTIEFLRLHVSKIKEYIPGSYWLFDQETGRSSWKANAGNIFQERTEELLTQFGAGTMFPWLRGEDIQT